MNQVQAVLALAKIKHDALAYFGNFFQRAPKLIAGVIDRRTEHITGDIFSMDAHEDRIVRAHVAHHHRQVHVAIDRVFESNRAKSTVNSRQISIYRATHENLFANAMLDSVRSGDDLP